MEMEREIGEALKEYTVKINLADKAYQIETSNGNRSVVVTWPLPLQEVYFDFRENDEEVLSESVEFYEGETNSELSGYVVYITRRFLELPWRIKEKGRILKTKELQVDDGSEWRAVFD